MVQRRTCLCFVRLLAGTCSLEYFCNIVEVGRSWQCQARVMGAAPRNLIDVCIMNLCMTSLDMYVCMYGHTYSKNMDQPGKVANPARGQLNRENKYSPVRVRA